MWSQPGQLWYQGHVAGEPGSPSLGPCMGSTLGSARGVPQMGQGGLSVRPALEHRVPCTLHPLPLAPSPQTPLPPHPAHPLLSHQHSPSPARLLGTPATITTTYGPQATCIKAAMCQALTVCQVCVKHLHTRTYMRCQLILETPQGGRCYLLFAYERTEK